MERGNNYQIKKSAKRLDTHEFKASKKEENEVKKIVKNEKPMSNFSCKTNITPQIIIYRMYFLSVLLF